MTTRTDFRRRHSSKKLPLRRPPRHGRRWSFVGRGDKRGRDAIEDDGEGVPVVLKRRAQQLTLLLVIPLQKMSASESALHERSVVSVASRERQIHLCPQYAQDPFRLQSPSMDSAVDQ